MPRHAASSRSTSGVPGSSRAVIAAVKAGKRCDATFSAWPINCSFEPK